MNTSEIIEQVRLANSNDPHDRNLHEGWLTRNAHKVFADYVKVLSKLEQLAKIAEGK